MDSGDSADKAEIHSRSYGSIPSSTDPTGLKSKTRRVHADRPQVISQVQVSGELNRVHVGDVINATNPLLDEHLDDNLRDKVLTWLSIIQYADQHRAMGVDFLKLSGQWLLKKEQFQQWQQSPTSSVLWLHGSPGTGKSRLTYAVIESIRTQIPRWSLHSHLAYFYCSRDESEPERADPEHILRTILKQLAYNPAEQRVHAAVSKTYKRYLVEHGHNPPKLGIPECEDLIVKLLDERSATIILDGLDECNKQKRHLLFKSLETLLKRSSSVLRVFVSSRDDDDLVRRFQNSPKLFIEASDNHDDISRYIQKEIDEAIVSRRLLRGNISLATKEKIMEILLQKSDAMFQWVKLQIENLCDPHRMIYEEDIIAELGKLPDSLESSYFALFCRIERAGERSKGLAIRALTWLLCAQRPLSVEEFVSAVAYQVNGKHVKIEAQDILAACHNLVVLDSILKVFRFAHLSVREFFEKLQIFSAEAIHSVALKKCLAVITSRSGAVFVSDIMAKQHKTFEYYAVAYWITHCNNLIQTRQWDFIRCFFFEPSKELSTAFRYWGQKLSELMNESSFWRPLSYKAWEKLWLVNRKYSTERLPSPSFIACSEGWQIVLRKMVDYPCIDLNEALYDGTTLLELAAGNGDQDSTKWLLENKFWKDPVVWDTTLRRAILHVTMRNKSNSSLLLEALLEAKRVLNESKATSGLRWVFEVELSVPHLSPIEQAVAYNNYNNVKLLLDAGADINSYKHARWRVGEQGRDSPLRIGIEYGSQAMIELLLDCGAIDSHEEGSPEEFSLLWRAVRSWNPLHFQVLLGREVNAGSNGYSTGFVSANTRSRFRLDGRMALHIAVKLENLPAIIWLLNNGWDINLQDRDGYTPLHRAVYESKKEATKLLIARHADLKIKNHEGETPLQLIRSILRRVYDGENFMHMVIWEDDAEDPTNIREGFPFPEPTDNVEGLGTEMYHRENLRTEPEAETPRFYNSSHRKAQEFPGEENKARRVRTSTRDKKPQQNTKDAKDKGYKDSPHHPQGEPPRSETARRRHKTRESGGSEERQNRSSRRWW